MSFSMPTAVLHPGLWPCRPAPHLRWHQGCPPWDVSHGSCISPFGGGCQNTSLTGRGCRDLSESLAVVG